ncbi:MAG: single-stranded DNA-binding protein [Phycisphaerales bacterium]
MAGNFNQVLLMGNLTRDVELKYTPSNQAIANIGLAINRRYTTAQGEKKEDTTFVDCEAWGKTAETMAKYLSKGRPVFITGRLKLDQWEDKNGGGKRSKLKVVVEEFQFIDSGGGGAAGGSGGGGANRSADYDNDGGAPAPRVQTRPQGRPAQHAAPEINEEDIPF